MKIVRLQKKKISRKKNANIYKIISGNEMLFLRVLITTWMYCLILDKLKFRKHANLCNVNILRDTEREKFINGYTN